MIALSAGFITSITLTLWKPSGRLRVFQGRRQLLVPGRHQIYPEYDPRISDLQLRRR